MTRAKSTKHKIWTVLGDRWEGDKTFNKLSRRVREQRRKFYSVLQEYTAAALHKLFLTFVALDGGFQVCVPLPNLTVPFLERQQSSITNDKILMSFS